MEAYIQVTNATFCLISHRMNFSTYVFLPKSVITSSDDLENLSLE